jgi:hypothetical protein
LISGFTAGICNNITPSTDGLTITSTGVYQVNFCYDASLDTNNKNITSTLYIDNTIQAKATVSTHHQNSRSDEGGSICCLLNISNGQKLSIYMKTSGGSSVELTAHKISLVLIKIA